jgi:hypothetical protein
MRNLYWGNSMAVEAIIREDGVAKDCTDFNCVYVLKEKDLKTAPLILSKAITWTNRVIGEGFFTITVTECNNLAARTYFTEIILYKSDGSFEKTILKDKLSVKQSLGRT